MVINLASPNSEARFKNYLTFRLSALLYSKAVFIKIHYKKYFLNI
jgi:hypothetical protein